MSHFHSSGAGTSESSSRVRRERRRGTPGCEALEGRRLLNGAWGRGHWHDALPLNGADATGSAVPAQVRMFGRREGGAGTQFGAFRGRGFRGDKGAPLAPSDVSRVNPQLQADLETLKTDLQALRDQIPADLVSRLQADQTLIDNAMASTRPARSHPEFPAPSNGLAMPTRDLITPLLDPARASADASTHFDEMLARSGLSSEQTSAIKADIEELKTTLSTLDPALQEKIAADRAAIEKDFAAAGIPAPGMGHRGPRGPWRF